MIINTPKQNSMKSILGYLGACIFSLSMLVVACTKTNESKAQQHEKADYQVLAVGDDTTYSPWLRARMESTALVIAEDTSLKAELIGYQNGHYTIRTTNKTNCQRILRWGWEDLAPVISIEPNDATSGTPQADVLSPNEVKTYTMIAQAKPGKIFVKAEKSNSTCENSSTLVIKITIDILPIKWISHTATYNKITDETIISYEVDDPKTINSYLIRKMVDGEPKVIMSFGADKTRKKYDIVVWEGTEK